MSLLGGLPRLRERGRGFLLYIQNIMEEIIETPAGETVTSEVVEDPTTPVEEVAPVEEEKKKPGRKPKTEEVDPEAPVNLPYEKPELPGTPCPLCKGEGLDTNNQRCINCTGTGRII